MPDFPTAVLPIPSKEALFQAFKRGRNSAPGPDRLTYQAWLAVPETIDCLYPIFLRLFSSLPAPPSLNHSIFVFPPKGDKIGDAIECLRDASEVRP
eukprot:7870081-Pyramimonas_sp.AAC.1